MQLVDDVPEGVLASTPRVELMPIDKKAREVRHRDWLYLRTKLCKGELSELPQHLFAAPLLTAPPWYKLTTNDPVTKRKRM